ncbi:hypothetical protein H2200_004716 [Cladophialophora chaetospira]|uniref:Pentatricopeptide repeat protein n=1 Tax=Cladophialophora chaetospira TaxID=386627 RepID=A0AA38XDP7_9EURO|nr:hypothetical protein H2200_004716 [Cladophialophora chaetospira]
MGREGASASIRDKRRRPPKLYAQESSLEILTLRTFPENPDVVLSIEHFRSQDKQHEAVMNPHPVPARPSPIVPSKNALRALRRLALSPSVLVVSTIGSVCGIATLNHEVNRRVRLAEQALESKRVIRSLSHGRGSAQLNSMIEAAERGDDFTLNTRGAKKRRKKNPPLRSFSAVALQDPSERTNDAVSDEPPIQPESRHTTYFGRVSEARATPRPVPQPRLATHTNGVHSLAVEKILHASKAHRKTPDHRTYGRPNPQRQSEADRAQNLFQTWFKPFVTTPDEDVPGPTEVLPTIRASDAASDEPSKIKTPKGQRHGILDATETQRDPTRTSGTDVPQHQWKPISIVFPPVAVVLEGDLQMIEPPEWATNNTTGVNVEGPAVVRGADLGTPTRSDDENSSQLSMKRSVTYLPSRRAAYLLSYLDDDEPIDQLRMQINQMEPSLAAEARIESLLESTSKEFVDHAKYVLNRDAFLSLCRFVFTHTSRRKWLATMRHLTSQHSTVNWTTAEAILHIYRTSGCHPKDLHIRPVFELVQHLLATVPTSTRIEQVLFPAPARDNPNDVDPFDLASRYLQFICDHQHSIPECRVELGTIVNAAKRAGLSPSKDLIIPVLRACVSAKDFDAAEDLLEGLVPEFGPTESLSLLEEYTFVAACDGSWAVVEAMLDRFHTLNRSRGQPIDSGRLFERLLSRHIAKNTSHHSFHFTVHAMKYAGLIPTNHVSRTLICAFIRDGRYDLMVEWLHLLKSAFPRVSSGFDFLQGGWLLTNALSDMGASCEEIARICQTIAHGTRRDPFGPAFREFAVDLVKADLCHRVCYALGHLPASDVSVEKIHSMTMEQLLKHAYEIRATPEVEGSDSTLVEGLKNDLAVQISAIVGLAKTFRGDSKTLFFGVKTQQDTLLGNRRRANNAVLLHPGDVLKRKHPEGHGLARSAGIGTLTQALVEHYDRTEKDGLPVDHSGLKHFIISVGPEYPAEVLELVEAIYASEFVQGATGAPFSTDLFKKWLYLVSTDGSVASAAAALSAVVESADKLEWTAHFRYLCEFVTQLGDVDNNALWEERRFPRKPERGHLRALYSEIRRIWVEQTTWRKETFQFPEWKGWEMDGR